MHGESGEKQGGSIGQHMTTMGQQCQRRPERKPQQLLPGVNQAVAPKSIQQATSIIIFWQV
ncbi:hypothetical protein ACNKHX_03425 [Shigella flexneri]